MISLGVCHDLAAARRDYPQLVFQGNVDEDLLRAGTPEQVFAATKRCREEGGGQRHIVSKSGARQGLVRLTLTAVNHPAGAWAAILAALRGASGFHAKEGRYR